MSIEEIRALPISEKIEIMEILWQDMRERFDATEVSSDVKALLDQRRERVRNGEAKLLDWDVAQANIGRA